MSELNQLLRQAHRIMAGNDPNTSRAVEDAKVPTGAGVPDASKVTALATDDDPKPKAASTKKADQSPNIAGDFADESHKGDPAYETALNPKIGSKKKAELEDIPAEAPVETPAEAPAEAVVEDSGCTNADIVEALEDVKQGIEDAKVEAGETPAADLLAAIEEVIDAVDAIQDAVSDDAMSDPAAVDAFKTASAFKAFFIQQRNMKAAKIIRQKLASHEASLKAPVAPAAKTAAAPKKAFDPRVLKK